MDPAPLAQQLQQLPQGVYFGWAQLDPPEGWPAADAAVHKMVMNVGRRPTVNTGTCWQLPIATVAASTAYLFVAWVHVARQVEPCVFVFPALRSTLLSRGFRPAAGWAARACQPNSTLLNELLVQLCGVGTALWCCYGLDTASVNNCWC